MVNYPKEGYPYYTWACTYFGCECEINDPKLIRNWDAYRKNRKTENATPTCFECGHTNGDHREGICYPKRDGYPYYTWSCTNFGCECTITDRDLIM